jgi:hypothetical protein
VTQHHARFGACEACGTLVDRRHLGPGKRTPFTRPAEPVLAAFEPCTLLALGESAHMSLKEATGVSEATGSMVHEGRKRPRVNYAPVAEVGVAP